MSESNKIKAVFLDRDDTVIDDPSYLTKPEQLKLMPGAADALRRLRLLGYKLIIVTNQSAVARGMITEEDLEKIHDRLLSMLAAEGVKIEKIYHCPFHPEGIIEEYKKDSFLRKPNPGMILSARDDMDIDLEQSWMIGDSYRDISAGKAAGCSTILINPPTNPRNRKPQEPPADYEAVNIKEAANIVKMFHQKNRVSEPVPQSQPQSASPESQSLPQQNAPAAAANIPSTPDTIRLLKEIRQAVISLNTSKRSPHLSIMKVVAGAAQSLVILCLIVAVIKLIGSQTHDLSVLKPLGFAVVFQLMAIMFYFVSSESN